MASTTLPPASTTIDNTLGAVLVGFACACCVYGILVTQVFTYFSRYPGDRPVYKFLVSTSSILPITRAEADANYTRSFSSCALKPLSLVHLVIDVLSIDC